VWKIKTKRITFQGECDMCYTHGSFVPLILLTCGYTVIFAVVIFLIVTWKRKK
jgi:hypothetical protein